MGKQRKGLSIFALRILAMSAMLCDHLWATIIPGRLWMNCVGRLAFPIFAYLLVEGYCHTRSVKKYVYRLLLFALLSEIPFNLMVGGGMIWPFHQNVLWTLLVSLLTLWCIEKVRAGIGSAALAYLLSCAVGVAAALLCRITMTDFGEFGVLTVLVFYVFRGRSWLRYLAQAVCLFMLYAVAMGGMSVPMGVAGYTVEISVQGLAVLALLPIWYYNGEKGFDPPAMRWVSYAFYPVHILLLSLIWLYW